MAAAYIVALTMIGLNFNGTYAVFNTLARTPTGEAGSVGEADLLEVTGSFDSGQWLNTGESGFVVTNVSPNKLWVYFTVDGPLGLALRHINPVCIQAGESYNIPIQLTELDELGLLGWRNNGRSFSGNIVARVLNNFSSYEVGSVTINGLDIYNKMVAGPEDQFNQVYGIKSVNDILQLIEEKRALAGEVSRLNEDRDNLIRQRDNLVAENSRLAGDISGLRSYIDYLSGVISSLAAAAAGGGSGGAGGSGGSGGDNGETGDSGGDGGNDGDTGGSGGGGDNGGTGGSGGDDGVAGDTGGSGEDIGGAGDTGGSGGSDGGAGDSGGSGGDNGDAGDSGGSGGPGGDSGGTPGE